MKKFVFITLVCLCFIFNVFGQAKIKVLKYEVPKFPAVAQATLTPSEVDVLVKINKDGKVISSKADNGHPFFRKIAEETATKWLFSDDKNLQEREIKITFAFKIKNNNSGKNNYKPTKIVTKFKKPYRLEILALIYPRVDI